MENCDRQNKSILKVSSLQNSLVGGSEILFKILTDRLVLYTSVVISTVVHRSSVSFSFL